VDLVRGGKGVRAGETSRLGEPAEVLLDRASIVPDAAAEVQALEGTGRDAAPPERESVDDAFRGEKPRGEEERFRNDRSLYRMLRASASARRRQSPLLRD